MQQHSDAATWISLELAAARKDVTHEPYNFSPTDAHPRNFSFLNCSYAWLSDARDRGTHRRMALDDIFNTLVSCSSKSTQLVSTSDLYPHNEVQPGQTFPPALR